MQPCVCQDKLREDETAFAIEHGGAQYATPLLFGLRRYLRGQALPAQLHQFDVGKGQIRKIVYIR
jgi:hypothetical protein